MKAYLVVILCVLFVITSHAQKLPYQNPSLSSEARAKDLVSRLTLKEKSALMWDISEAVPRLGIKKFNWWSEALHGYANNDSVTVFPEPVGMAASFDDALVYRIFVATADEGRAKYNQSVARGNENRRFLSLSTWAPNVNIFRDPRWGRGQETYGEDPYLTTRMGLSVVKGLQGPSDAKYRKLLACAKHFAVHSGPEWSRHTLNLNNVDPRDLWETYLPAFKALVQEGDVRQVMCAYQRLDDEPCCGNSHLLQDILRREWGFKYVIVSDCDAINDFHMSHKVSSDAVHASAKAVRSGTDLECAWDNSAFAKLPDAVAKGLVTEQDLDNRLVRVLEGRFDLGEMDNDSLVPWTRIPASVINNEEHKALALTMARETMVLLQNRNGILPLAASTSKIAVVGPNADNKQMLWGNYNGTPIATITILDGIRKKLSPENVVYEKGCDATETTEIESAVGACVIDGKPGFRATYWNNRERHGDPVVTEHLAGPLTLTTADRQVFSKGVPSDGFSAKFETVYKATRTGEMTFKVAAVGGGALIVNGDTLRPLYNWRVMPIRVRFKVDEGKEYKIEIPFTQLNNWTASLDLEFGQEVPVQFNNLLARLTGVDVVIFAGGLSSLLEGEEMPVLQPGFRGGDRTDIELPAIQRSCLKALHDAGKRIVFVNCSGSAIGLVPETECCDAILQAWYAGESGGQAVADVLYGDYNPSGKLPITFYKDMKQLPDFEDYSMKGRTYRFMSDPLFPFGYGLSYTSFSIGNVSLSKTAIAKEEGITLKIPVTNSGKRDGTEIVQVYVHKVNDADGPLKTLRGFQRVTVAAGKTAEATIALAPTAFAFYDRAHGTVTTSPGTYEILYGSSSAAKDLKTVTVMIH